MATKLVYDTVKIINAENGISGSHISHNFKDECVSTSLIANEAEKKAPALRLDA